MKQRKIPETPYDEVIGDVCGHGWRQSPESDIDGAMGVAIALAVAHGVKADLVDLSDHLNIAFTLLKRPFERMSLAGVFKNGMIEQEKDEVKGGDEKTLCYYAAYASGHM